jgi:hypothetical protein
VGQGAEISSDTRCDCLRKPEGEGHDTSDVGTLAHWNCLGRARELARGV